MKLNRKRFSVLAIAVSVLLSLFVTGPALAAPKDTERIEAVGAEAEKVAKESGIPIPKNTKLVRVVKSKSAVPTALFAPVEPNATIPPPFWWDLRNIWTNEACGTTAFRSSSGAGPGTLAMDINTGIKASFSTSITIGKDVVSGALGFNVEGSVTITDSYEVEVPAGQVWTLKAYPYYTVYHYEIWRDYLWPLTDQLAGNGDARLPIGVCFAVYE